MRVVISAGPTREPLDPVRFISNYSTGTLGLTLARIYSELGHEVVLAHGPIEVPSLLKVRKRPFETVLDLMKVLNEEVPKCDVLYMVAAVSDFKPLVAAQAKIKKGSRFLNLSLVQNPDVLKSLRRHKKDKLYVGFSLESKDIYKHSLKKLREKGLDMIVAQKVNEKIKPFGPVSIDAMMIDADGSKQELKNVSKDKLAGILIKKVAEMRSLQEAGV